VRRRAFLSRARGRCYRQADSSSGTAAARDREFKKKDGALAVCEKDKRRDWLKKPGEENLADWRSFGRRRRRQVEGRRAKFYTAPLPRALRLARTSHDELREHGGSRELRRGFARGRDRERASAQARGLDQHESHLTVRPVIPNR
jgi:hypothetical protein